MKKFSLISKYIDLFNTKLGKAVSWLTLLMVITSALIVILRYGFNLGFIWMQEAIRYMYAAVFLVCAAYTYAQDEHVRVDIFYMNMSIKYKKIVDIFGSLLFLIPVCLTIIIFSYNYLINSWLQLEGSLEERGLHAVYILKSFIWIFSFTLILQGISIIITNLRFLLKNKKEL